jgi:hypothetical protein
VTLLYRSTVSGETAVVKARMSFDSPLVEWEVDIETVPVGKGVGKEVTVNFHSYDIENYDNFYVD